MTRKWIIGTVAGVLVAGAGLTYYKMSLNSKSPPEVEEVQPTSPRASGAPTEDTFEQVSNAIARATEAEDKKEYVEALRICDKAIARYGDVPSGGTSSYREVLEAKKGEISCFQRRGSEKTFPKTGDLVEVLILALKSGEPSAIAKLLRCGVEIGVPDSEADPIFEPEKLAADLASLRKDGQTGNLLPFKAEGDSQIITTGYSDGNARRFDFAQDEKTREWFIQQIVYGPEASLHTDL